MEQHRLILGIESSCDDTAAAVVRDDRCILSSVVLGQNGLHEKFGGVVPEIAARAHAERLDLAVEAALEEAGCQLGAIDAIAVTAGPGLIGGVLSGVMCAKGIALGARKPLIGVNHLAGHALTPRLSDDLPYPYLMLLISGGHCQFLVVHSASEFTRLGSTIDDSPGEAFDKTAKLLGLGYPGGPLVEEAARSGDPTRFAFPRPLADRPGCDMSFSGLKTALRRARDLLVAEKGGITQTDRADLCAGFQQAVSDVLALKTKNALEIFVGKACDHARNFAVAGGVAANQSVRQALADVTDQAGFALSAPPLELCTDNAAMIAWAGQELFAEGQARKQDLIARPRWPLDQKAAPLLGSGKKGAKA